MNVAGLYGAAIKEPFKKRIIVVGASHAKRICDVLNDDSLNATLIETPTFRLMSKDVAALTASIRNDIDVSLDDDVVLVLNVLDNTFFVAKTEDGHYYPIRKHIEDSSYHVEGDISCSPVETSKQLFANLFPLLKEFQEIPKVVLVPIPRYVFKSCCENEEHVPNVRNPGHVEDLVGSLDAVEGHGVPREAGPDQDLQHLETPGRQAVLGHGPCPPQRGRVQETGHLRAEWAACHVRRSGRRPENIRGKTEP
jgi:hypothetical protein